MVFTISGTDFTYGAFLNVLIAFLAVAAVIFFLVIKPMNAVMTRIKRDDEPASDAPAEDVQLLTEIRDLLRERA